MIDVKPIVFEVAKSDTKQTQPVVKHGVPVWLVLVLVAAFGVFAYGRVAITTAARSQDQSHRQWW